MPRQSEELASLLSLLSEPSRRQILLALTDGPCAADALSARLAIDIEQLRTDLRALEVAGCVTCKDAATEFFGIGPMASAVAADDHFLFELQTESKQAVTLRIPRSVDD